MANDNENETITQEQYDQLKVELEGEKAKSQEAVVLHEKDQERITSLEASVQEKEGQLQAATTEIATFNTQLQAAKAAHDSAVEPKLP